MAGAVTKVELPSINHERWCNPTEGRTEVRVEQFTAFRDDPATGRTAPAMRVTRCLECGEARYDPIA